MLSLFLFNTSTLGHSDILKVVELAGINKETNFSEEIVNAPAGVKDFLNLLKIHFERDGTSITFDRLEVKPTSSNKKVEDVSAIENEIRFVYDDLKKEWSIVTKMPDGNRFQKKIEEITPEDAKQSSLAGIKLDKLKDNLKNKQKLTSDEWGKLKSECFSHPNPISEVGDMLRKTLDESEVEINKITNIREYLKNKSKEQGISLILYSNKANADNCEQNEANYVKNQVDNELSQKQQLKTLYIGAGHGWPTEKNDGKGMLSALTTQDAEAICKSLKDKKIHVNNIVFGSCFSASYANTFSSLLTKEGVMLSSTLSQGSENFFVNTVDVITGKKTAGVFFEKTQHGNLKPTGICITQKDGHIALKLDNTTGKPDSSGDDEYDINRKIIQSLQKSNLNNSRLTNSLHDCSEEQQKNRFNQLLPNSLNTHLNDKNNYSFLLKAGAPITFGIGIAGIICTGIALKKVLEEPSYDNKLMLGIGSAVALGGFGLFKAVKSIKEEPNDEKIQITKEV